MEENKCLNCGTPIQKTEGKRAKIFCSAKCRVSHHNKNQKGEAKYVLKATHERTVNELNLIITDLRAKLGARPEMPTQVAKEVIEAKKPPENKPAVKIQNLNDQAKTNYSIDTANGVKILVSKDVVTPILNEDEIRAQIEAKRLEIKNIQPGQWANRLRNSLEREIKELQKQIP